MGYLIGDATLSIRTILIWNFPVMILDREIESSDGGIEVFCGVDRVRSEAG